MIGGIDCEINIDGVKNTAQIKPFTYTKNINGLVSIFGSGNVKKYNTDLLIFANSKGQILVFKNSDSKIINGTFRSNITMGYLSESIEDIDIWQALETANLADFVHSLPQSLETRVGERGAKISGGQRQRLGIARALLTKPKLLILDESTSALDGQTESDLSKSIRNLKGSTTILVIAHRLSTVRDADQIVYLSQGKVICKGRFNEVRSTVPDFDKQAKLMGL
jgi:ABC-type multidrug transport system fused ATPase/permease subunit